jgi:hypothetical protein
VSERERSPTATDDPVSSVAPAAAPTAPGAAVVVDLAALLDTLRLAAGKAAALAEVTVESYDNSDWHGADPALVERTAYLLGAVAEAAVAVVAAVDKFQGFVADQQRAEGGDEWW